MNGMEPSMGTMLHRGRWFFHLAKNVKPYECRRGMDLLPVNLDYALVEFPIKYWNSIGAMTGVNDGNAALGRRLQQRQQVRVGRARKLKREAVESIYEEVYPTIVRLSRGLCGREDVVEGIVRFLMGKALKVLPGWRDATEGERWFMHHTVLSARRAAGHEASAQADLLAAGGDAAMKAFARGVRMLPQQQREPGAG
jgi:hypothetical protein